MSFRLGVYSKQFSDRRASLTVTEKPNRFVVEFWVTKSGEFPDLAEFEKWIAQILGPFESDPRPIEFVNKLTGEKHLIQTALGGCIVLPNRDNPTPGLN